MESTRFAAQIFCAASRMPPASWCTAGLGVAPRQMPPKRREENLDGVELAVDDVAGAVEVFPCCGCEGLATALDDGVVLAVADTADAADPAGDVEDALVVFTGIRASRVRVVQELPSTLMALVGHRHRRHSLGPVLER